MIKKFNHLLFGLSVVLLLNSCSQDVSLAEITPASVEDTSELKMWATKNDKLNQANLIDWDYSTQITLSDNIKGFSAPVKSSSADLTEFITFELGGKRHGWYKSYKRLNETDMEIIIKSIEGETLRSGFLRKTKTSIPKGKAVTMREMNSTQAEIDFEGTMLEEVTVTAPRLPQGGGYVLGYGWSSGSNTQDYYGYNQGGGSGGGGSGGGSQNNINFYDSNYTKIKDQLTNPCFKKVLDDLRSKNIIGIVGDMVREFNHNEMIKLNFAQAPFLEKNGKPLNGQYNSLTNTITLNESALKNASQEYIACIIIHEMFHACINLKNEQRDHTLMYNQYVESAGKYLNSIYGINIRSAENLFLAGLNDADGYQQVGLYTPRWLEINNDLDIYKYNFAKIGHYCK